MNGSSSALKREQVGVEEVLDDDGAVALEGADDETGRCAGGKPFESHGDSRYV